MTGYADLKNQLGGQRPPTEEGQGSTVQPQKPVSDYRRLKEATVGLKKPSDYYKISGQVKDLGVPKEEGGSLSSIPLAEEATFKDPRYNLSQLTGGKTQEQLKREEIINSLSGSAFKLQEGNLTGAGIRDFTDVAKRWEDLSPDEQEKRIQERADYYERLKKGELSSAEKAGETSNRLAIGSSIVHMDSLNKASDRYYTVDEIFDSEGNMYAEPLSTVQLLDRTALPRKTKIALQSKIFTNFDPYGTGSDPAELEAYLRDTAIARSGEGIGEGIVDNLIQDMYSVGDSVAFNIPSYLAHTYVDATSPVMKRTKDYLAEDKDLARIVSTGVGRVKVTGEDQVIAMPQGLRITIEEGDSPDAINDKIHEAKIGAMARTIQQSAETGAVMVAGMAMSFGVSSMTNLAKGGAKLAMASKAGQSAKASKMGQSIGTMVSGAMGTGVGKTLTSMSQAPIAKAGAVIADGVVNGVIAGHLGAYAGYEAEGRQYGALFGGGLSSVGAIPLVGAQIKQTALDAITTMLPKKWGITQRANSRQLQGIANSIQQNVPYDELPVKFKKRVTQEGYEQAIQDQQLHIDIDGMMEARFGDYWNVGKNDPGQRQHFFYEATKDEAIRKQLDELVLNTTNGQHTVRSLTNKGILMESLAELGEEGEKLIARWDDVLGDNAELLRRIEVDAPYQYTRLYNDLEGHLETMPYQMFVRDVLSAPPSTTMLTLGSAQHQIHGVETGVTTHIRKIISGYQKEGPKAIVANVERAVETMEASRTRMTTIATNTFQEAKAVSLRMDTEANALMHDPQNAKKVSDIMQVSGTIREVSDEIIELSRKGSSNLEDFDLLALELKRLKNSPLAPPELDRMIKAVEVSGKLASKERKAFQSVARDHFISKVRQSVQVNGTEKLSATRGEVVSRRASNMYDNLVNSNSLRLQDKLDAISPRTQAEHPAIIQDMLAKKIIVAPQGISEDLKGVIDIHNQVTSTTRGVGDVMRDSSTVATKYSTVMRLANNAPTEKVRTELHKMAMSMVDEVGGAVNDLPLPRADKVRVLKAINQDLTSDMSEVLMGTKTTEDVLETLSYRSFYENILQMQKQLGAEVIDRYGELYKSQFGSDLNIAEFLGVFVTPRSGYDADKALMEVLQMERAEILFGSSWGKSISKYAENEFKAMGGGKNASGTAMGFRGYDAFQANFADKTGLSASDAITQKNVAYKQAKKDLMNLFEAHIQPALNKFINNSEVKELWTIAKGVGGFDKKFNTHLFSETGALEITPVGKIFKEFVESPEYDNFFRAHGARESMENVTQTVIPFFEKRVAQEGLDINPEEMATYFTSYFGIGGKAYSRKTWAGVWENLAHEALIDAKKLEQVNLRIREGNTKWAHKGYQVSEIKHRQYRNTNMLAGSDSFLAESTHIKTVESRMYHRHKSSSDIAQQQKIQSLDLKSVADPIESIAQDARDLLRYGNTVHASRALDDLGLLSGTLGYKAHAGWLAREGGTMTGLYQQHAIAKMLYKFRKNSSTVATLSNMVNILTSPYIALASLKSTIFTTAQAGLTHAGTVGVAGKGTPSGFLRSAMTSADRAIGMPIRTAFRALNVFKYDKEGMVRFAQNMKDPHTNRVVEAVISELGDAPVRASQDALMVSIAGKRQLTTAEKASLAVLKPVESANTFAFSAIKERTERLISRDVINEGVACFSQIENLISKGQMQEARGLLDRMAPTLRRADQQDMIQSINTSLKLGQRDSAMKMFLSSYHDGVVGRFGFHTAPDHIKKIASFLPGASQFYASKMLAFTRVAQYATGSIMGKSGQINPAGALYGALSMVFLGMQADMIGRGDGSSFRDSERDEEGNLKTSLRAGLLPGAERLNPLPSEVLDLLYSGVRFANYGGVAEKAWDSTVGKTGAMFPSGPSVKSPAWSPEMLVQMLISGSPSSRISASNFSGMELSAKLKLLQLGVESMSMGLGNVANSLTPEANFSKDLAFRMGNGPLIQAWSQEQDPEKRAKALTKVQEEYEKHSHTLLPKLMDVIVDSSVLSVLTKGILEDPFLFITACRDADSEFESVREGYIKYNSGKAGKEGHIPYAGAIKDNSVADLLGEEFYTDGVAKWFGLPDKTYEELLMRYDTYMNKFAELGGMSDTEKASYRHRFEIYAKNAYALENEDLMEIDANAIELFQSLQE
jgi:hypothetical protein